MGFTRIGEVLEGLDVAEALYRVCDQGDTKKSSDTVHSFLALCPLPLQLFIDYNDNAFLDKMGFILIREVSRGLHVAEALYRVYDEEDT